MSEEPFETREELVDFDMGPVDRCWFDTVLDEDLVRQKPDRRTIGYIHLTSEEMGILDEGQFRGLVAVRSKMVCDLLVSVWKETQDAD